MHRLFRLASQNRRKVRLTFHTANFLLLFLIRRFFFIIGFHGFIGVSPPKKMEKQYVY